MSEGTVASFGGVDVLDGFPFNMDIFFDHHLGDSFARGDGVWLVGEVDEDDADVATEVGVYGAGGVDERKAVFERESGAGTDLAFIALRQLHAESGRD